MGKLRTAECEKTDMGLLENTETFYQRVLDSAAARDKAKALTRLLGISFSTAEKYLRPVESDENPTATGRRNDLARVVDVIDYALQNNGEEIVKELIDQLQVRLDEALKRRVIQTARAINDPKILAAVLNEITPEAREKIAATEQH